MNILLVEGASKQTVDSRRLTIFAKRPNRPPLLRALTERSLCFHHQFTTSLELDAWVSEPHLSTESYTLLYSFEKEHNDRRKNYHDTGSILRERFLLRCLAATPRLSTGMTREQYPQFYFTIRQLNYRKLQMFNIGIAARMN